MTITTETTSVTTYRCDKCRIATVREPALLDTLPSMWLRVISQRDFSRENYDLCPECAEALEVFMRGVSFKIV